MSGGRKIARLRPRSTSFIPLTLAHMGWRLFGNASRGLQVQAVTHECAEAFTFLSISVHLCPRMGIRQVSIESACSHSHVFQRI